MENLQNPLIDVHFRISEKDAKRIKKHLDQFLLNNDFTLSPQFGEGKGIVISAGGFKYFTCTYILVANLRETGCQLPIEVWHYGNELSSEMIATLSAMGVTCRDMMPLVDDRPHGFLMKPLSILYSHFAEVLMLDADNTCLSNPEYLFYEPAYIEHGSIFWPDYWKYSNENQIWDILHVKPLNTPEQESGQLLINKKRCYQALSLAAYLNINSGNFYHFMYGDKDTFSIAWHYLDQPYHLIAHAPGACGYTADDGSFHGITMTQHDCSGNIIFMHRNLHKWDITDEKEKVWNVHKLFKTRGVEKSCSINQYLKGNFIDMHGDVDIAAAPKAIGLLEEQCLAQLKKLRQMPFYNNELLAHYILANR
ncbi:hypothetical protein [Pedobacter miscanthi]|uniref:hypothetical protein n=1 Tax=Pedobacter miscanthi TaxID=2259170 RepID=UPI00292CA633|nr:hypothetical protein [Pedobacter miscanthi]